ncbi:MAG TPA: enoyl-CoA hydratase/isomerase family protein [Dehalococcoidia bacterium]|nr:enoyl-CoA hydratase/isomerase family protein [Dehalococcoidia bacterium]
MEPYETIFLETLDGGVGRITLNRPEKLNAVNVRMGYELVDALRRLEEDEGVRAVVLTGAGRSFCSGDDLSGMESEGYPRARGPDAVKDYVFAPYRWTVVVNTMRRLPKPVVGAIRGHAHGAGFNLAMGTDIRIASDTLDMALPFVKWGMATGVNQTHYAVPLGIALEMAFTGESIGAERAERLGLVNRVVADAELESASLELARALAAGPTRAIGLTKAAIYKGWWRDLDATFDYQAVAQTFANQTADREEGRRAFQEKRRPRFEGR